MSLTHAKVLELLSELAASPNYVVCDISGEKWREVELSGGLTIHIEKPITLVIRRGGSTHRVVDSTGVVHCYVAPESGNSVIRWKNHDDKTPVNF